MIGADPAYYLARKLRAWGRNDAALTEAARVEYLRCFSDPACIHASCEAYRAAAGIDLEHDGEDAARKSAPPLLALWGAEGFVGKTYDVLAEWRKVASNVSGHAVPGGHYVPEEAPEETLAALMDFL